MPRCFALVAAAALATALATLAACSDDDETPSTCDDPTTFTNAVQPILAAKCLPCHSSDATGSQRRGARVGLDFDTYDEVAPIAAEVADAITSGREPPPPVMPPLEEVTSDERDLVRAWRLCNYPR